MEKENLRKRIQQKRNQLTKDYIFQKSLSIAQRLSKEAFFQNASRICIYQAFRNEVSCEPIMEEAFRTGKKIFVPVTDETNKKIEFYEIFADTMWKKGAYGILEPVLTKRNLKLQNEALIIMPGLVFDEQKHRLGYGGGYYDRYLASFPQNITIGICFDFQVLKQIPFEHHDICPDYVITEKRMIQ